jgi:putative ABC transport system permease protein
MANNAPTNQPTNPPTHQNWSWPISMAWRDSRTHRKRLLLYMASIIIGTAALVAINTLGNSFQEAVDGQARTLLGADLSINSQAPFGPAAEALIDSLGGDQSREISFTSMVYFPENGGTRIAQVRAITGGYPYYGELVTDPIEAGKNFQQAKEALVDDGLMLQFDLKVGEDINVGKESFRIAGRLLKIPGENAAISVIGPRVYIPMDHIDPKLLERGSRVSYKTYFKFEEVEPVAVEQMVQDLRPDLRALRLSTDTIIERQQRLGRTLENMYRFLNLGGFIALLLGGIGVASAIHAYIKQKMGTIAVLRCLGAVARQTFYIYLIQALAMGLIGSAMGVVLGLGVMNFLPAVLGDFLPVELTMSLSLKPVIQGMLIGLSMTVLFALLPLIGTRNISPLLTLRSSFEGINPLANEPRRFIIYGAIAVSILLFSLSQTTKWIFGVSFSLALGLSFGLLFLMARLIMYLAKRYLPVSWSYIWRQSLANLYRPNNQTVTLMVALGLGTLLLTNLYLTQHGLLNVINLANSGDNPNMVLFDIQSDQKETVTEVLDRHGLSVLQQVPIVTMRIASVKGQSVADLRDNSLQNEAQVESAGPGPPQGGPGGGRGGRVWRREFRASYGETLSDTEEIIAGQWQGGVTSSDSVFVSLTPRLAESMGVTVGDEVVFDVQGFPITAVVGSLRNINPRPAGANFGGFFAIRFPAGVLESAPQFHVLLTRTKSTAVSAAVQREIVQTFPNISIIDLDLILSTVDAIFDKVSLIIRFMALFSVATGLIVLVGVITNSRYQRVQESVLLKTLGAVKRQVLTIMVMEYFFLGFFAVLTGMILAIGASWALAFFVFDMPYTLPVVPVLAILLIIVALTVIVGLLCSRGIHNSPPLEILRDEV